MQLRKLALSSVDLDIDGRQPMREAMLRAMASVSSSHPPFAILSADGDCVCTASVPISPRAMSPDALQCLHASAVEDLTRGCGTPDPVYTGTGSEEPTHSTVAPTGGRYTTVHRGQAWPCAVRSCAASPRWRASAAAQAVRHGITASATLAAVP